MSDDDQNQDDNLASQDEIDNIMGDKGGMNLD